MFAKKCINQHGNQPFAPFSEWEFLLCNAVVICKMSLSSQSESSLVTDQKTLMGPHSDPKNNNILRKSNLAGICLFFYSLCPMLSFSFFFLLKKQPLCEVWNRKEIIYIFFFFFFKTSDLLQEDKASSSKRWWFFSQSSKGSIRSALKRLDLSKCILCQRHYVVFCVNNMTTVEHVHWSGSGNIMLE